MNKIEEITMSPIRGFTLVEVMIVLAIVMILTTLAYPGYAEYFMRNNGYLAFSAASTEPAERQFRAWSGASAARSAYEMEGRACPGQAITDCIEVRATPGTQQVDSGFKDPACGVLTLDSVGRRSASGTSANCWP
jgi:type IV pilus assembly protein PilE